MATSSQIQFVVEEFGGDASAVTRLVGLEPSAIGVPNGKGAIAGVRGGMSWIFDVAMPQTESIEGQALALLRFLESHAEAIRQAAIRYPASIAIAIQDGEGGVESGGLRLIPLVATEISQLGLGLRIHFSPRTPQQGRKQL